MGAQDRIEAEMANAEMMIDEAEWTTCVDVLRQLVEFPEAALDREEVERLIAKIYKKARKERRKRSAVERADHDRELVEQTGRVRKEGSVPPDADGEESVEFRQLKARSRDCYICKEGYREVHHFYHMLCPACARLNWEKREQRVELSGRIALVTGGRIKIGYQTALKLLRCGAEVAVTTRFPNDAARRYASESDFEEWSDRLTVYSIDFRDVPGVVRFVRHLNEKLPALDILVNNAAQSVKRSAEYYDHLARIESESGLPANLRVLLGVDNTRGRSTRFLPALLDRETADRGLVVSAETNGEIVDLRERNSWTSRLEEVEPVELLEVFLVNSNAPSLLTSGLKPLFQRSSFSDRYIVNVTGADGVFERAKSVYHPHVNMSKAALNMMTRTSAEDYAADGIYMNSVDTGWITHEAGFSTRMRMRDDGFVTPLDVVDGAARIVDPIVRGIEGVPSFGRLFRHYEFSDW